MQNSSSTPAAASGLAFDLVARTARRGGLLIALTAGEWALIDALLMPNAHIWAELELVAFLAHRGWVTSPNAIRIHLCNIRRKLGWNAIQTLPGRGYRMPLRGQRSGATARSPMDPID